MTIANFLRNVSSKNSNSKNRTTSISGQPDERELVNNTIANTANTNSYSTNSINSNSSSTNSSTNSSNSSTNSCFSGTFYVLGNPISLVHPKKKHLYTDMLTKNCCAPAVDLNNFVFDGSGECLSYEAPVIH